MLVYCETCRNDTPVKIIHTQMTQTLKGAAYTYDGKEARCECCNSPVYVPEIMDDNLKSLYDAYRDQHHLISLEKILEIPEKYDIGKRPLSLLLGWGEQTFSRYCDGDLPTRQYSDILLEIYNHPASYAQMLEAGKDKLKSPAAYEKSKKAVDLLLNGADSSITLAIRYLLSQCEDITPLALQKILYYVQGFYYAFYGQFMFEENCEAWVHGPVYRNIYNRYRDYRFDPITQTEPFDPSTLTAPQKSILDSVIQHLCCYSGKALECFTHNEAPWLLARGDLPLTAASDHVISKSSIGAYFSAVKSKYNMINPHDIRTYAQAMFSAL